MKECPACKRCFADHFSHCPTDGDTLTQSLAGEPVLDGRYQLESRLGHGGMGIVFRARHIFLKTSHAIKVVLPDLVGNDPSLVTRFRQEAMAAAAIRHPNIIAVTDFGVARGTMPFLVMEFIKGKSLQDILAEHGRLSPQQTFEIIAAVGAGVGAAHRQGIVHRDLKPLNVMIQDGVTSSDAVKVLDFGLAKIKSGELLGSFVQAQTTGLMGSPFYMAPEQWSDEEPDRRADIYSLGIIIYQMLAGDVPFKGASMPSIMKKHLTSPPPPFAAMGLNIPAQIERVIFRALEKDPLARPQTVEDLIAEFRLAVSTLPPERSFLGGIDPLATNIMYPVAGEVGSTTNDRLSGTTGVASSSSSARPLGEATANEPRATQYNAPPASGDNLTGASPSSSPPPLRAGAGTQMIGGSSSSSSAQATETFNRGQTGATDQPHGGGGGALGSRTTTAGKGSSAQRDLAATNYADASASSAASLTPEAARQFEATSRQERGRLVHTVAGSSAQSPEWSPASTVVEPFVPAESFPLPIAPKKSSLPLILSISALVVVLALVGGGYALYRLWHNTDGTAETIKPGVKPQDAVRANQPPQQTTAPDNRPNSKTAPVMIAIQGGTYQMGTNDVASNAQSSFDLNQWPAHPVTVKNFMMQKTEVTNAAYFDFVRATNHASPADWVNNAPPAGQEMSPVHNVSYDDANAYAVWRSQQDGVSYRLPTEEEWEYAARSGGKYNLYPWGDEWVEGRANMDATGPKIVGSYPQGANLWGVEDLIGNVSEWTSSEASLYPGNNRVRIPAEEQGRHIQRGGSFVSATRGARSMNALRRGWSPNAAVHPTFGFRLARVGHWVLSP